MPSISRSSADRPRVCVPQRVRRARSYGRRASGRARPRRVQVGGEAQGETLLQILGAVADDRDALRIESESDGLRGQEGPAVSSRSPLTSSPPVTTMAARGRVKRSRQRSRGDDEGRPHRQAHAVAVEPTATFWLCEGELEPGRLRTSCAGTRSSVPLYKRFPPLDPARTSIHEPPLTAVTASRVLCAALEGLCVACPAPGEASPGTFLTLRPPILQAAITSAATAIANSASTAIRDSGVPSDPGVEAVPGELESEHLVAHGEPRVVLVDERLAVETRFRRTSGGSRARTSGRAGCRSARLRAPGGNVADLRCAPRARGSRAPGAVGLAEAGADVEHAARQCRRSRPRPHGSPDCAP